MLAPANNPQIGGFLSVDGALPQNPSAGRSDFQHVWSLKTLMQKTLSVLFLTCGAALTVLSADESAARLGRAATAFEAIAKGIKPGQTADADCIGIIPGFKKGAAGLGVGFGKGFISCRNQDGGWSAPGAITL
jgi:hypothetical protein